jgi:hypothetical protein
VAESSEEEDVLGGSLLDSDDQVNNGDVGSGHSESHTWKGQGRSTGAHERGRRARSNIPVSLPLSEGMTLPTA